MLPQAASYAELYINYIFTLQYSKTAFVIGRLLCKTLLSLFYSLAYIF